MKKNEYEVKILNIDIEFIKKKLTDLEAGSIWVFNFKRHVYDFSPIDKNKWVRLRTDGTKTSLTIKEISTDAIDGTHEIEVDVSDFETTHSMLEELWYNSKSYQENMRESYLLNWVNIEIDSWPKIPSYIEIEWNSEDEILEIVKKLWYTREDTTSINTKKVYELYGLNLEEYSQLTFK